MNSPANLNFHSTTLITVTLCMCLLILLLNYRRTASVGWRTLWGMLVGRGMVIRRVWRESVALGGPAACQGMLPGTPAAHVCSLGTPRTSCRLVRQLPHMHLERRDKKFEDIGKYINYNLNHKLTQQKETNVDIYLHLHVCLFWNRHMTNDIEIWMCFCNRMFFNLLFKIKL